MTEYAAAGVGAALSLGTALGATPLARVLASRVGVVAVPAADRWHQRPTALLGGLSIVLGTVVGVATRTLISASEAGQRPGSGFTPQSVGVGLGALFMFAVGLIDDVVKLRPQLKFVLQTLGGVGLVGMGVTYGLTPWYAMNVVATVFAFVALTNAFNLLDNMDGVAAGVAAIAAVFLGVTFAQQGAWLHAGTAWALAGAACGFLWYNFHPATVFMGDAGSLFIGSLLAGLVVTSPASASGSLVSVLFVPLAIVAVPIVDTALVAVTRTLAARSIAEGGRDHSTHRLVALGLGERQVALLLYAFATVSGVVGLVLMRLDTALGLTLGAIFLAALSLLAAYLGRLQVGYADGPVGKKPLTVLVTQLLYKRRLAEILLDVLLVTVGYYGAFRLRFEGGPPPDYLAAFESTLGVVIALNIGALGLWGAYRGAWRYAGIGDVYRIVGAILSGTVALFMYVRWRTPLLSHSNVLYIDPMLTAALVLTARLSFRSLEMVRKRLQRAGERVLIYGAGDGGELAVRELLNNAELRLRPFGFLDDDPHKHGAQIHGVRVLGGLESLPAVVGRHDIRSVLIATKKLPADVLRALQAMSAAHGLRLLELQIIVRTVADGAAHGSPGGGPVALSGGLQLVERLAAGGS